MSQTEFFTVGEMRAVVHQLEHIWEYLEQATEDSPDVDDEAFELAREAWPVLFDGEQLVVDDCIHVGNDRGSAPFEHFYLMPSGGLLHEVHENWPANQEPGYVSRYRYRIYETPLTKANILDLMPTPAPVTRVTLTIPRTELLMDDEDD